MVHEEVQWVQESVSRESLKSEMGRGGGKEEERYERHRRRPWLR